MIATIKISNETRILPTKKISSIKTGTGKTIIVISAKIPIGMTRLVSIIFEFWFLKKLSVISMTFPFLNLFLSKTRQFHES